MSLSRYRRLSRRWLLGLLLAGLLPAAAHGQAPAGPERSEGTRLHNNSLPGGAIPLGVDFKRAPLGSWAAYTIKVGRPDKGDVSMAVRWALLERTATGNTLELSMEGPAITLAPGARNLGKVVTRLVLVPDPIGVGKPVVQMVMQVGDRPPMEIPLDLPGLPQHKFQNPDAKKLVGRETITIGARALATSRYHDVLPESVVDSWLSTEVPPLGVVKIVSVPRPGAVGPGGQPLPPVTMELTAHGKDARPAITRPPVPFVAGASEPN